MSIAVLGTADADVATILDSLKPYEANHPRARVEGYRVAEYIVNVRVTDPDLAGIHPVERHHLFWQYFEHLPLDVLNQLGLLVTVTPGEAKTSGASLVFDDEAPRSS